MLYVLPITVLPFSLCAPTFLVKLFSYYPVGTKILRDQLVQTMSRLERPPSENQGDYPRAADGTIDFTRMTERQQLRFLMSGGADNAANTSTSTTSSSDKAAAAAKNAATPEPPAKRTSSRRASSRSSKNVSSTPDAGDGSLKRARTASRGKSPGPLLSDKKSKTTTTSKTLKKDSKKDSKKESVTSGGSGSASGRSKTTPRGGATKAKGGRGSRSSSSTAAVAASPRNPAVSSPRPGNLRKNYYFFLPSLFLFLLLLRLLRCPLTQRTFVDENSLFLLPPPPSSSLPPLSTHTAPRERRRPVDASKPSGYTPGKLFIYI